MRPDSKLSRMLTFNEQVKAADEWLQENYAEYPEGIHRYYSTGIQLSEDVDPDRFEDALNSVYNDPGTYIDRGTEGDAETFGFMSGVYSEEEDEIYVPSLGGVIRVDGKFVKLQDLKWEKPLEAIVHYLESESN